MDRCSCKWNAMKRNEGAAMLCIAQLLVWALDRDNRAKKRFLIPQENSLLLTSSVLTGLEAVEEMNHTIFAGLVESYQFWKPICANQHILQVQMITQRSSKMTGATSWNWIIWKFTCGHETKLSHIPFFLQFFLKRDLFPSLRATTTGWCALNSSSLPFSWVLGLGQCPHGTKHHLPSGQLLAVPTQALKVPSRDARPLLLPCLSLSTGYRATSSLSSTEVCQIMVQPQHQPETPHKELVGQAAHYTAKILQLQELSLGDPHLFFLCI